MKIEECQIRTLPRWHSKEVRSLLSLCKRERIKVRDDLADQIPQAHTRSLEVFHRGSRALRRSRTGGHEFPPRLETLHAFGLSVDARCRRDQSRRARRRGELPGNRNRGCSDRSDADAGICSRSGSDCAVGSRESARPGWRFCAGGMRDSLDLVLLNSGSFDEASLLPPHLNPLPRKGGEETSRIEGSSRQGSSRATNFVSFRSGGGKTSRCESLSRKGSSLAANFVFFRSGREVASRCESPSREGSSLAMNFVYFQCGGHR